MIAKLRTFFEYAESDKFRKILKWIVVGTLLVYLFTSISAYAEWFPGSTHYFVFSSKSGLLIRIVTSLMFGFACFLVYVSFRKSINYKWLFVFGALLFVILLCMFYTPTYYSVLYRTTKLYDFMAQYETSVSIETVIKMYFSFAVDVLFAFCFVFVLPHIFDKRTLFLYVLLPFMLIIFYSLIYSLFKEKEYYIRFVKGDWEYNAVTIGSIFGNKQQWGIFLAPSLPVSFLCAFFICKSNSKKVLKIISCILLSIFFILTSFCALASFCKTAIISNFLFICFIILGIIFWLFINKRKLVLPIILSSLVIVGIIGLVVFMKIDSLHESGIGKTVFNIINTLFTEGSTTASSRLEIMLVTLQNFPATNIFFGFSKGVLDCFVRTVVPYMNNGLHTGLAIYFGRTGIIGSVIYIVLLGIIIWSMIKIMKKNCIYGFAILGTFVTSFILNLSELEILIVSSSATVYILNLILVTLPISETIKEREYAL